VEGALDVGAGAGVLVRLGGRTCGVGVGVLGVTTSCSNLERIDWREGGGAESTPSSAAIVHRRRLVVVVVVNVGRYRRAMPADVIHNRQRSFNGGRN
jgi:hypothetical protein